MALTDSYYRIKIDMNYTTTGNANTAASSINAVMSSAGRPERCTVTSTNVYLLVVGMTESEAVSLRNSLLTAWTSTARSGGKVSCTRTNDTN